MKKKIINAIPILLKFRERKNQEIRKYIEKHFNYLYEYLPEDMIENISLEYWINYCSNKKRNYAKN